jgi:hypothetical protein
VANGRLCRLPADGKLCRQPYDVSRPVANRHFCLVFAVCQAGLCRLLADGRMTKWSDLMLPGCTGCCHVAPLPSAYRRQRSLPSAGRRQSACIVTVLSVFCYIPAFSKDIYDIYSFNLKHSPCIQHLAVHRMQENT